MRMSICRRSFLLLPLLFATAAPVFAQENVVQDPYDWAKKMFDGDLSKDFGAVARGAEVSHRFKVTNLYKEDARIASVTTSCGCTAPRFDQTPFKSRTSTYIDISMDTNRFQHDKARRSR